MHLGVYLIENMTTGALKIGFSCDPAKRVRQLQTASADPLQLIATFVGTVSDEAALHKRFDPLRLSGEWFTAHPEIFDEFSDRSEAPRSFALF